MMAFPTTSKLGAKSWRVGSTNQVGDNMEDWTKRTDEQVFAGVGEQLGSQASHWRDIEIKRRLFLLQQKLLNAQIDAVETQRNSTAETAKQSKYMFYSTIGVFLTALVTLATAYIK